MRILVTGGLGYIGWPLAATLAQANHDVTVLTRKIHGEIPPSTSAIEADLCDPALLSAVVPPGGYDVVCHLAGLTRARESFTQPLDFWEANVVGTLNLLRAITRGEGRTQVILASSNVVYGSQAEGSLAEDQALHPESPYADTKLAAERLLSNLVAMGSVTGVVLRIFNAAGAAFGRADADPTRLIPNVLRAARGELPSLIVNGDGSARRDFTHVLDVVDAFHKALNRTETDFAVYNVGSGVGATVAEVVATAQEITGMRIPVTHLPPKNEPHTTIADSGRIQSELHWRPLHSDLPTILRSAWEADA